LDSNITANPLLPIAWYRATSRCSEAFWIGFVRFYIVDLSFFSGSLDPPKIDSPKFVQKSVIKGCLCQKMKECAAGRVLFD
jgi:hypothetical protein